MSNQNYIIPNIQKKSSIISNFGYVNLINKTKKNNNISCRKQTCKNNNVKSKIELLHEWINNKFYKGKLKELCDSRKMFCQGGSMLLYKKLLNPINQIFLEDIGANTKTLSLMQGYGHFYITIKIKNKLIYIDPTFGQFVQSHNKIFVGTIEDIREYMQDPINLSEYEKIEKYPPPRKANGHMEFIKNQVNSSETFNNNNISK